MWARTVRIIRNITRAKDGHYARERKYKCASYSR